MASAGIELIVLDSVGAGVPRALFEKSIAETGDRGQVGANAAAWSQFLPKLKARCRKTGTTIIAISQIRDSINTMGYGDKITVQGGKAFKFYSAVRMKLQKVGSEKASEYSALTNKADQRVTGAKIKAKLDKCKVSDQQNNEEYFYIRWGEGIDDLRSIIEIAISHNVIRKKGAWLYWNDPEGEEHGKQGMEKFRSMFAKDPEKLSMLEKQVRPHMASKVSDKVEEEDDDDFDPTMLETSAEIAEIIGAMDDD
jgi:recombination protein RecA